MTQSKGLLILGLAMSIASCDSRKTSDPSHINADGGSGRMKLSGEQLFVACQACHNLASGGSHKVGPNLFGIIDQPAATREGFSYSAELSSSNIIWSKNALTGWVLATETVVPGTWMTYHNHLTPEEAVTLVDYIATQK